MTLTRCILDTMHTSSVLISEVRVHSYYAQTLKAFTLLPKQSYK